MHEYMSYFDLCARGLTRGRRRSNLYGHPAEGRGGGGIDSVQFYTYAYIVQRSQINDAVQYTLSFLTLAALLFVIFKYLRSRFVSRYRDLIVILLLTVLFLGGVQYGGYTQTRSDREQTSRMALFLHRMADDLGVTVDEVRTNSSNLKQGMLVSVHGTYYMVTFNADFTSFRYDWTHLMSRDVQIVDKED